jgi:hypothetical protein
MLRSLESNRKNLNIIQLNWPLKLSLLYSVFTKSASSLWLKFSTENLLFLKTAQHNSLNFAVVLHANVETDSGGLGNLSLNLSRAAQCLVPISISVRHPASYLPLVWTLLFQNCFNQQKIQMQIAKDLYYFLLTDSKKSTALIFSYHIWL